MKVLAFDCETELIPDRTWTANYPVDSEAPSSPKKKVFTSPWVTPRIVVGSYCDEGRSQVLSPSLFRQVLILAYHEGYHLVGHNVAFDVDVICAAFPEMDEIFTNLADEGRLHDTGILDQLYGLYTGRYDMPKYFKQSGKWGREELLRPHLDDLAKRWLGITLDKNPRIRLGFGQFLGQPLLNIPQEFLDYAKQDAVATYRIFQNILQQIPEKEHQRLLSEDIQVRNSLVTKDWDKLGVHVDKELAHKLALRFQEEDRKLWPDLLRSGIGRAEPVKGTQQSEKHVGQAGKSIDWWLDKDGVLRKVRAYKNHYLMYTAQPKLCINQNSLRIKLHKYAKDLAVDPPRTEDGSISLEHDFWAQYIPADHPTLGPWMTHTKIQKILSTYLNLYSHTDKVFPSWHVLGARTGRMSASAPSIMNVPKRKLGIRALFIPAPGCYFVKADYCAQEMFTLCEAMLCKDIKGKLYEVLTSGKDIHRMGASLVLNKPYDEVTKDERQGQKVLNFGVPGGLGPASLADYAFNTYGVKWTVDEARYNRQVFLDTFLDIDEYLYDCKCSLNKLLKEVTGEGRRGWADHLETSSLLVLETMKASADPEIREIGNTIENYLTIRLPTGRYRSKCRFTEGANYAFQGLASDVTKEALWLCRQNELQTVMAVHDEIVVQAGNEEDPVEIGKLLACCMKDAFVKICPRMGPYTSTEVSGPLDRWGNATDMFGNIIGD